MVILASKLDFQGRRSFGNSLKRNCWSNYASLHLKHRFKDAKTVLYDSGTTIMGSSVSSGENSIWRQILHIKWHKIGAKMCCYRSLLNQWDYYWWDWWNQCYPKLKPPYANIIMGVGGWISWSDAIVKIHCYSDLTLNSKWNVNTEEPKKIIHLLKMNKGGEHSKVINQLQCSI
jgi:cell division protein FtsZ